MSTSHREDLSALIDGALGKSEAAFLLRRLEHDDELRSTFARYHLIRDCLRGHGNVMPAPAPLAERVRAAVANEARPGRPLPWQAGLRWAAGFFTAALVATGAFWYVQPRDDAGVLSADADAPAGAAEVVASGVRADDLRRQLPLLPVAARQSRTLVPGTGEFAPQPDPETWQKAPVAPLYYPSTQYIIVLPAPRGEEGGTGDAR